jgi:hypothetical protein
MEDKADNRVTVHAQLIGGASLMPRGRKPFVADSDVCIQKQYDVEELLLLKYSAFFMLHEAEGISGITNIDNLLRILFNRHNAESWFKVWIKVLDIKSQQPKAPIRFIAEQLNMDPSAITQTIRTAIKSVEWIIRTSSKLDVHTSRKLDVEKNTIRELALNLLRDKAAVDLMRLVGNDADKAIVSLSSNFSKYFTPKYMEEISSGKRNDTCYAHTLSILKVLGLEPIRPKGTSTTGAVKTPDNQALKSKIRAEIAHVREHLNALEKMLSEL